MINENQKVCRHFQNCDASICPEQNPDETIWFPDESVCRSKHYAALKWVRKQKKIQRKTKYRDFYFTKSYIEKIRRVTSGTRGLRPDKDIPQCLAQNHPEFYKKSLAKVERTGNTISSSTLDTTNAQKFVKTQIR
jgi:hypothetical protein